MPTYDVLPHHGVKDQGEYPGKTQAFAGRGKVILVLIHFSRSRNTKQYVTAFKHENYFMFATSVSDKILKYMVMFDDKVYFLAIEYFPNFTNDARLFSIEESLF